MTRSRILFFALALSQGALACSLFSPSLADYAQTRAEGGHGGAATDFGGAGSGPSIGGLNGDAGQPALEPEGGMSGAAGAAGAEPGPCISSPESCNGLDDDCDGVTDNGCPSGFLRGATTQRPNLGDSAGGSAFADLCKDDEVITGFQLALSETIYQIAGICQKYTLHVNTKPLPYAYTVLLSAPDQLPAHPTSTNSAVSLMKCPAGSMVVAVDTLEQYGNTAHTGDTRFSSFAVQCAEPIIQMTGPSPSFAWQNVTAVGPVLTGIYDSSQTIPKSDMMSTSEVLAGLHGNAGFWVDRIGLTSSKIQVLVN